MSLIKIEIGVKGNIWSELSDSRETSVWRISNGSVAIWNTFHRSVPDGALIGIIVGYSCEAAVNSICEAKGHPYGILLRAGMSSGWSIDSPFQWIAYNLQSGRMQTEFPGICF